VEKQHHCSSRLPLKVFGFDHCTALSELHYRLELQNITDIDQTLNVGQAEKSGNKANRSATTVW